jgi:NADPH-dependent 2,4-dienoyl-CoA reductase/sulfur reductase-like enzyme
MISRRNFLIKGIGLSSSLALASSYSGCSPKIDRRETLRGPNHTLGHKLRMGTFPKPTQVIKTEVAIVGGGVSGLAAARILKQRGIEFKLTS